MRIDLEIVLITILINHSKKKKIFLSFNFEVKYDLDSFLEMCHNMLECLHVSQMMNTRCVSFTGAWHNLYSPWLCLVPEQIKHIQIWSGKIGFFFWRNLLPWKLPFGCQVFVVLCAKAVIAVRVSEGKILPPHLSTNYSLQMSVRGGSFYWVSETDILVSGARALLTHAVLALLYRGVALSLGRRLLILSKSWEARLSSPDSACWSLELYL